MKEVVNVRNVRLIQLLWSAVAIVFVAFEIFVIYSHVKEPSFSFSSWLFYEPVILALPFLTGSALYRRLKGSSKESNTFGEVSYALALITLVSYITLWIGMVDHR